MDTVDTEDMAKQRTKKYYKKKIPKALREAVWIKYAGRNFTKKCLTPWCLNIMNAFDFQTSHNIPESKGGATVIDNLMPLCGRCNLSMGSQYNFKQWCALKSKDTPKYSCFYSFLSFFRLPSKATVAPVSSTNPSILSNPSKS